MTAPRRPVDPSMNASDIRALPSCCSLEPVPALKISSSSSIISPRSAVSRAPRSERMAKACSAIFLNATSYASSVILADSYRPLPLRMITVSVESIVFKWDLIPSQYRTRREKHSSLKNGLPKPFRNRLSSVISVPVRRSSGPGDGYLFSESYPYTDEED